MFLLDTIGELASLYQFADLAFVGGSLVPRADTMCWKPHSSVSPSWLVRIPRIFATSSTSSNANEALRVVTHESLIPTVMALLENDAERDQLGRRALQVMQMQQGATERTVAALHDAVARRIRH